MGSTAAQDIAGKAAPRSDMRDSRARSRSKSQTRSPSVAPRSRKSRSRSHSRERSSRRHRSRSPTHRKPHDSSRSSRSHRSSRRSHRSRSRSTSRDRRRGSGSRRSDHRSSRSGRKDRHRDRSVSRSRSRGRHGHCESSNRKRRHYDRSPSSGRRRGSGDGDELSRRDRQRRRRDSSPDDPTRPPSGPIAADPQVLATKKNIVGADKAAESTPTSQESIATSTGAMTATTTSSQSDSEMLSQQPIDAVAHENGKEKQQVETPALEQMPAKASAKVDVQSIKMNILKALADARSAIADIKGATDTSSPGSGVVGESSVKTPDAGTTARKERDEDQPVDQMAPQRGPQSVPPSAVRSLQRTEVAAADVDEFDIFSAADRLGSGLPLSPVAVGAAPALVDAAIQSNYDDPDGYYKPSIGEVLNGKYRVLGTVGKGVFSTVLRCQLVAPVGSTAAHENEPEVVAIKLIRSNEVMREASQIEIKILTELSARDPRDKKHCVRLLERFEHRNHVALVFEPMQMNVREAMKKFGGKGGISIQAVRIFCKHLLIALTHLEACNVVHADIKPDNVLLDDKQTMIKLCDFGSAFKMQEGNHDPTPYLVSRFYRAPEIVLGLPYDKAVDMWSVGCCLYEMFTGKVLFPGATNNEMLKLFMELKGKVPNKIIKKHRQAYIEQFQMEPHFTEDNKFISRELDRVTNKPVLRYLDAIKTRFDLGGALLGAKSSTDDRKQVLELRNLLERMFTLDPTKRITPKEALAHPFVKTEATTKP